MLTNGLPYPNFARACFAVAIDNGGINRFRSVKRWRNDYKKWAVNQQDLTEIDRWCSTLSDDQIVDWASAEQAELVLCAPPFADVILDKYFEEIC